MAGSHRNKGRSLQSFNAAPFVVSSRRMTDEEREKAQEQLKALNQAYNELSQHCSDHNNSAEEVGLLAFSSIAFSFRKWRHLLSSCTTNSFPSVQCEQLRLLCVFYCLALDQSRRH